MDAKEIQIESRLEPFALYLEKAAGAGRRGRTAIQKIWLEAAEALFPLRPENLTNLVREAIRLKFEDAALRIAEALCEIGPDDPAAQFRLGSALQLVGRSAEAIGRLERALALNPDFPQAHNNLAAAFMALERPPEDILPLLETAVAKAPDSHEGWSNLATQRLRVFDLEGALTAGERAVALDSRTPISWNNRAQALKEDLRFAEAEACFEAAVRLSDGDPLYRLNLGLLHLLLGRYASGWEGFENRWRISPQKIAGRPVFGAPPWSGEPLEGKTLLIWGEEGNGDVIQFCRFLPRVAALVHAQGGRVLWNSYPHFGDLLARSLGSHADQYVTGGLELLPPYDYEFGLLSSPRLLGVTPDSIPRQTPYLRADPARRETWRARLAMADGLKVGLVWTGSAEQGRNPFRSVSLARYAEAFGHIPGVRFFSLQMGGAEEVAAAKARGLPIEDLTPEIGTYEDTAAVMEELDLVITICTSTAHLAGALARPVWVVLDVNPHWVWGLNRSDNDWYPTARVFRQTRFGVWDDALAAVGAALSELVTAESLGAHAGPQTV